VPSRRTFTSALQASVHCGGSYASQSWRRRPASLARAGSGPPVPSRRTFTSALQASVHCGGSYALQSRRRRPASLVRAGSGLPVPSRRTFTSALQASVHCGGSYASQSLLRLLPQPARGHGQPLTESAVWMSARCMNRSGREAAEVRKHGGAMDAGAEGLPAWRAGPLRTAVAARPRRFVSTAGPWMRALKDCPPGGRAHFEPPWPRGRGGS
jgi:hypothetical protein